MDGRIKLLLEYRQELVKEEKMLKGMLSQLEEQINVLQIEQFHLSSILSKPAENNREPMAECPEVIEKLDLKVPMRIGNISEEEEEEEQND